MTEYLKYRKKDESNLTNEELSNYQNIIEDNLEILGFKEAFLLKGGTKDEKFPGRFSELEYINSQVSVMCDIKENLNCPGFLEINDELYHLGFGIYGKTPLAKKVKTSLESVFDDCKELEKVK
jgi:hypothetical protein